MLYLLFGPDMSGYSTKITIFLQGVGPQEYTIIKMKVVEPYKGKLR